MQNISNSSLNRNPLISPSFMQKVFLVQALVGIFLYVNCLMIFTFLKKEVFREDTRYILFAQTLFVDSAFMVLTDIGVVGSFFQYQIHMIPCIIFYITLHYYITLHLADAFVQTVVSHAFTAIAYISVNPSSAFSYVVCSVEVMLQKEWQAQARAVILLLLFLFMLAVIVFTYIKIMIAARAASSEKKKSTSKSLRTVLLHGFQLFLSIVQFITPYIEMPFWKLDVMLFINVRYSNFIVFILAPRCLSPLIYGMRDEKFFLVLRHYALWGFNGFNHSLLIQWKIRPS
uniref:G-protein coupled receptors family 1 profile domain-containing protein n=1 Tax=Astyanax mexicanus TaxID=7994 RepID=A0A8B9GUT3_ASTMX